MTKMDMVWIVVATLIFPQTSPGKTVSKKQIDEEVARLFGMTISPVMITKHLVNSVDRQADKANPQRGGSRNRYLFRGEDGRFRLYKTRDHATDAWEKTGPTNPAASAVETKFAELVTWYESAYR